MKIFTDNSWLKTFINICIWVLCQFPREKIKIIVAFNHWYTHLYLCLQPYKKKKTTVQLRPQYDSYNFLLFNSAIHLFQVLWVVCFCERLFAFFTEYNKKWRFFFFEISDILPSPSTSCLHLYHVDSCKSFFTYHSSKRRWYNAKNNENAIIL